MEDRFVELNKLPIMKTFLLSFLSLFLGFNLIAENDIFIYSSSKNEKFTMYIDGMRVNRKPTNTLRILELQMHEFDVTLEFENKGMSPIRQTIRMKEDNKEYAYTIEKTKKNYRALKEWYKAPQGVVEYKKFPTTIHFDDFRHGKDPEYVPQTNNNENKNQNINNNDININVNVINKNGSDDDDEPRRKGKRKRKYHLEGYHGDYGCDWPMSERRYKEVKRTIKSNSFDDTKLKIAKQIIDNNCLLTDQVIGIINLLTFENNKLKLAKFAYSRTLDQGNYFKVNRVFDFNSSVEELTEYIHP